MTTHLFVVSYDIINNKRRKKVADTLGEFGDRANKSVFECILTERQYTLLKDKIKAIVDAKDCVLYYRLCENCRFRKEQLGEYNPPPGRYIV